MLKFHIRHDSSKLNYQRTIIKSLTQESPVRALLNVRLQKRIEVTVAILFVHAVLA